MWLVFDSQIHQPNHKRDQKSEKYWKKSYITENSGSFLIANFVSLIIKEFEQGEKVERKT